VELGLPGPDQAEVRPEDLVGGREGRLLASLERSGGALAGELDDEIAAAMVEAGGKGTTVSTARQNPA